MKTYHRLWNTFLSDDNIKKAICNSSKGKRKRKYVSKIYSNQEEYIPIIRNYAINFKNKEHKPKQIYDGVQRKKRTIIVPQYIEQIIHHMVVQTLMELFTAGMYEHTYASIPKRGCYSGMKTIKRWIKSGGRHVKYCFKADIRKYFESIPHDILINKLQKKIKDKRFLQVVEEIISVTDRGIPLGFYTSQWFANWYLMDFDHFVKETLGVKYYIRYMDDIVMFGSSKRELHKVKNSVRDYLKEELGLDLKDNWQVFRFDYTGKNKVEKGRALDFMGYKFYRNHITLRKDIIQKARRKAYRIGKKKATSYNCKQMLAYMGWIHSTDTYHYYLKYIKPYINIKEMKKTISRHDKKLKRKEGSHDRLENRIQHGGTFPA